MRVLKRAPQRAGGWDEPAPPSAQPSEHFVGAPDVTISRGVSMKGELSFPKLLRVEGTFTGSLNCGGDIARLARACVKKCVFKPIEKNAF